MLRTKLAALFLFLFPGYQLKVLKERQTVDPDVCYENQIPADIVFVLDASTSIGSTSMFGKELQFVTNVVDYFNIAPTATQVGVISFSTNSFLDFPLNRYQDKTRLKSALRRIPLRKGDTYTDKALRLLLNEGFSPSRGARRNVEKIGILITDGESTDRYSLKTVAAQVLNEGYRMFAIGIGAANRAELERVASNPSRMYVHMVDDLDALDSLKEILVTVVCKPTPEPPTCENMVADIAILADESTSISNWNFLKELEFIGQLAESFDIRADATRLGLITFASEATVRFDLDTYHSSGEIRDALRSFNRSNGYTFTWKAIDMMVNSMFSKGRPGVPKIGIIITDGKSSHALATEISATIAKDRGVALFAIGVGEIADSDELTTISSDPDDYFTHYVEGFSSFGNIRNLMQAVTCEVGTGLYSGGSSK